MIEGTSLEFNCEVLKLNEEMYPNKLAMLTDMQKIK